MKIRLEIDESVPPVIQHVRRVPIALKGQVEQKLQQLLDSDIIERVNGASRWASPVVVIVKDNGQLRLCVDMRRANAAIRREIYPMPTIDDVLARLSKAKWFSRLDVREAYHQLELEEGSREITTFITHKGLFRYKRLMFGVCSASEAFQKIFEQIISPCGNTLNFQDDVIIWGEDETSHDQALRYTLEVLREHGVGLNLEKCEFKVQQTIFLGHRFSSAGVKPSDDKMTAIEGFRTPNTVEEMRSFLGLVGYIGRFIPDLATKTFPLRELIKAGAGFNWQEEHQRAFETLKSAVKNVTELAYFEPQRRTRVVADASPVALGAVLVQFKDDEEGRPLIISFASKSLTDTERRYCQTEKEALALVWAVEKFEYFLLGRYFELETDHRPLASIFKPTSQPPARVERWVLHLQHFNFKVIYKSGKQNVADPFSRLSTPTETPDFDDSDDRALISAIVESVAVDVTEIREAMENDEESQEVRQALASGNWNDVRREVVKDFLPFKDGLAMFGLCCSRLASSHPKEATEENIGTRPRRASG